MNFRALVFLTLSTCRRYAREPRVVRSLLWPVFLTPLTLALTLLGMTLTRSVDPTVAVPMHADDLTSALVAADFTPIATPDPRAAVRDGRVAIATDGEVVWSTSDGTSMAALEEAVRSYVGSEWIMHIRYDKPSAEVLLVLGATLLRPLAMLFILYALVFALGGITRDRDEQVLDVHLSLPLPGWGPVLAHWLAAVLVLSTTHAVSVWLLQLVMPAQDPMAFILRGTGAIAAAAAIGVAVSGGASSRQSFSGAFGFGTILVTAAAAGGPFLPWLGTSAPLCTTFTNAPGASSFILGMLAGPPCAWFHDWHARRSR